MDSYQVIVRPLHTEKSVDDIRENNAYHFEVHPDASKNHVRRAIGELFPDVEVRAVRTMWVRGKPRRVGLQQSRTRAWKKAIVQLRQGDTIDIGY